MIQAREDVVHKIATQIMRERYSADKGMTLLEWEEFIRAALHSLILDHFGREIGKAVTAAAEVGHESIDVYWPAAASEVGEFPEPTVDQIEARWERKFKDAVQNILAATIERCARWLTEEAKALRSMVSGGDGSERQWIEADALDRAAAQLRKEEP